jgi:hypothetical protein
MKKKYIFDNFGSYKSNQDKYYDLDSYMKIDKYGNTSEIYDIFDYYKIDKSKIVEETTKEKEARLLKEKVEARNTKIDQILKK